MARESHTSSTLGEPIPHTEVYSDLHNHPYTMKLKNKFSFGPPQDRPLLWAYAPKGHTWGAVIFGHPQFGPMGK